MKKTQSFGRIWTWVEQVRSMESSPGNLLGLLLKTLLLSRAAVVRVGAGRAGAGRAGALVFVVVHLIKMLQKLCFFPSSIILLASLLESVPLCI